MDFGLLPTAGTVSLAGVLKMVFLHNVNESFDLCYSPINLHLLGLRFLAYNIQSRVSYHIALSSHKLSPMCNLFSNGLH